MIALALAGCTPEIPEEVRGLRVVEARIESISGGGMQVVGGGWSGSGDLVAETVSGEELVLPVTLAGGSFGLVLDLSVTPGSKWSFGLPGPSVPASHLFGKYRGSRESLIVLVGAVGTHLENEHGVRIDDTSVGLGLGLSASWQWLHVDLVEPDDLDTGDPSPAPQHTGGDLPTTDHTGGADLETGHTGR